MGEPPENGEALKDTGRMLEEVNSTCKAALAAQEAAKAAKAENDAKEVGMQPDHVKALQEDCASRGRLWIMRASNKDSLKYHGKEDCRAKPHEVEALKTAKEGKHAGLVVRPEEPTEKQLAEITRLENASWWFDDERRLRDPEGNMIHGDYDMQGVYKEVGTDAEGKPIYNLVDTNSDSSYFLEDMNEMINPQRDMFHHGANDNYTKTDFSEAAMAFYEAIGRQPEADEEYLVVDKNGTQVIKGTAGLQTYYEKNKIPWPYRDYMKKES